MRSPAVPSISRLSQFERIRAAAATIHRTFEPKELDFFQFRGEPYFIAYVPPSESESPPWRNVDIAAATALHIDREYAMVSAIRPDAGTFTAFEREKMWNVATAAMPGVRIEDATWISEYDSYYYSRECLKPFAGTCASATLTHTARWLCLDPQRGVMSRLDRSSRWNRWLYHGLHSLDFPFLYHKRPLWGSGGDHSERRGVAISVTSPLPAWRRIARSWRALIRAKRSPAVSFALTHLRRDVGVTNWRRRSLSRRASTALRNGLVATVIFTMCGCDERPTGFAESTA